jgi:hypothetical protein
MSFEAQLQPTASWGLENTIQVCCCGSYRRLEEFFKRTDFRISLLAMHHPLACRVHAAKCCGAISWCMARHMLLMCSDGGKEGSIGSNR